MKYTKDTNYGTVRVTLKYGIGQGLVATFQLLENIG